MPFFEQFDREWGNLLGLRKDTFHKAFEYLGKKRPTGHLIVETGCARQANNWAGDGQSTFLFDRFASEFGGQVHSVDIDPAACSYARSIVGPATSVTTAESVKFLRSLAQTLLREGRVIDLLYLDSFDLDFTNPTPSAVHHLKELCSAMPALGPGTLVMVDDSYRSLAAVRTSGTTTAIIGDQGIAGKGLYVAQYFQQLGVPLLFEGYQCGWIVPD